MWRSASAGCKCESVQAAGGGTGSGRPLHGVTSSYLCIRICCSLAHIPAPAPAATCHRPGSRRGLPRQAAAASTAGSSSLPTVTISESSRGWRGAAAVLFRRCVAMPATTGIGYHRHLTSPRPAAATIHLQISSGPRHNNTVHGHCNDTPRVMPGY